MMAATEGDGDITIRPAREADLPTLGRLGRLLVAVHHGFDADRFIAPIPSTATAYAAVRGRMLAQPEALVLVADRGVVLGYCYAGIEGTDYMALRGPAGIVYDLIVDPSARRRGIGRNLLDAA